MLALAAAPATTWMGIDITVVEVAARGDSDGIGLGAANVRYRARVESSVAAAGIEALLERADAAVAEVHNALRAGAKVRREPWGTA